MLRSFLLLPIVLAPLALPAEARADTPVEAKDPPVRTRARAPGLAAGGGVLIFFSLGAMAGGGLVLAMGILQANVGEVNAGLVTAGTLLAGAGIAGVAGGSVLMAQGLRRVPENEVAEPPVARASGPFVVPAPGGFALRW